MTNKNLVVLVSAAVVLGGAAYFLGGASKGSAPKLNGKAILPGFNAADVAKVEIGGKLTLAASDKGWVVESLYGYPASRDKIAENLLKLTELKVGQVARGRKLGAETAVSLKDASGKAIAELKLGDTHSRKATGQAAMYGGGYPDGRYLAFEGETVLVKDTLDAFDGDPKKWCDTRIASISSSDVTAVAFSHAGETVELEKGTNSTWVLKGLGPKEELGFSTGFVYTVTVKEGSNTVQRTAHVGNKVKGGSDRYFKLDDGKWIFTIASYSADNMSKKRSDLVKAKEEPKKDDTAKEPEAKKEEEKK